MYVNGKEVWDGGGALSGQQQTGLSQQWHSEGNTDAGPDPDHTETESPQGTVEVSELERRLTEGQGPMGP